MPSDNPQPTTADWAACRDVARKHGRSFFLASQVLPDRRKRAIRAAYAYCRIADDIVDQAGADGAHQAAEALSDWRDELERPRHPVGKAFAAARAEFQVPDAPVLDLLDGVGMDLQPRRYANWNELSQYCYFVAGTVGLIVAPMLGCDDDAALGHAAELGIAMQLTNILRDVAEDADMGRLYLPEAELREFDLNPDDVMAGNPGPRFPEFMAFQIARARSLYASAMEGVPALAPSGRLATLMAGCLYAGILEEIERRDHQVFAGRAIVPAGRKTRMALATGAVWCGTLVPRRRDVGQAPTSSAGVGGQVSGRYLAGRMISDGVAHD